MMNDIQIVEYSKIFQDDWRRNVAGWIPLHGKNLYANVTDRFSMWPYDYMFVIVDDVLYLEVWHVRTGEKYRMKVYEAEKPVLLIVDPSCVKKKLQYNENEVHPIMESADLSECCRVVEFDEVKAEKRGDEWLRVVKLQNSDEEYVLLLTGNVYVLSPMEDYLRARAAAHEIEKELKKYLEKQNERKM